LLIISILSYKSINITITSIIATFRCSSDDRLCTFMCICVVYAHNCSGVDFLHVICDTHHHHHYQPTNSPLLDIGLLNFSPSHSIFGYSHPAHASRPMQIVTLPGLRVSYVYAILHISYYISSIYTD
jgi:hypothetical protein